VRIGDNLTTAVDERWGFGLQLQSLEVRHDYDYISSRGQALPTDGRSMKDRLTLEQLCVCCQKFTLIGSQLVRASLALAQVDAWRYRNRIQVEHLSD